MSRFLKLAFAKAEPAPEPQNETAQRLANILHHCAKRGMTATQTGTIFGGALCDETDLTTALEFLQAAMASARFADTDKGYLADLSRDPRYVHIDLSKEPKL